MASAFQANAFQQNAFQIDGAAPPVVVQPDSGMMAHSYSRSKLRKWIEELKEARAAVARAAREAAEGERKAELKEASAAAEEAIHAATLAVSDGIDTAELARQTQRITRLLNTAAGARNVVSAIRAAEAARRYVDDLEEEEEATAILRMLH